MWQNIFATTTTAAAAADQNRRLRANIRSQIFGRRYNNRIDSNRPMQVVEQNPASAQSESSRSSDREAAQAEMKAEEVAQEKSLSAPFFNVIHRICLLPIDDRRPMDAFRYVLRLMIRTTRIGELHDRDDDGDVWHRIHCVPVRERIIIAGIYAFSGYYAWRVAAVGREKANYPGDGDGDDEDYNRCPTRWLLPTLSLAEYMFEDFGLKLVQIVNLQISLVAAMGVISFTMALVAEVNPVMRSIYLRLFGDDDDDDENDRDFRDDISDHVAAVVAPAADDNENGNVDNDNREQSNQVSVADDRDQIWRRNKARLRQNSKRYWKQVCARELTLKRQNLTRFNLFLRFVPLITIIPFIFLPIQYILKYPIPSFNSSSSSCNHYYDHLHVASYYVRLVQFFAMLYFQGIMMHFYLHMSYVIVGLGIVSLSENLKRIRTIRADMRIAAKSAAKIMVCNFFGLNSVPNFGLGFGNSKGKKLPTAIQAQWTRINAAIHLRRLNNYLTMLCKSNDFFRRKLLLTLVVIVPSSQTFLIVASRNRHVLLEPKSWLLLLTVIVSLAGQYVIYFFSTYSSARLNKLLYGSWREINQFNMAFSTFHGAGTVASRRESKNQIVSDRKSGVMKPVAATATAAAANVSKKNFAIRWKVANYLDRMRPRWDGEGVRVGSFLLVRTVFVALVIRYIRYTVLTAKLLKAAEA